MKDIRENVNGEFWVLAPNGQQVLRDLKAEAAEFTHAKYYAGEFDAFNYVWYENFDCYDHESLGCDYERMGCYIREGDVVLDIGANIGVFSRRAEARGASRVIALEPVSPTFSCLLQNVGPRTEAVKKGIAAITSYYDFGVHTDFTHIGGGSSVNSYADKKVVFNEKSLCVNVNSFFQEDLLNQQVDFMKVDIEGGEYDLFSTIEDKHLEKMRCVALELHNIDGKANDFQASLISKMDNLGFTSFALYYGDGSTRTLNFWKR